MKEYSLIIIGGGSAGMAAAIEAYKNGVKSILIIEREKELGGILLQCIHNGFGLHTFGEELSGPAYAERFADMVKEMGITYITESMVLSLSNDKVVQYANAKEGYVTVKAKAVILAMGCRERTRGAIAIPGYRPSGILTAGTAQRYINLEGYLVGKKVFILGSGDIGLIMARRMTLEGAKVLGVAEIMPYSNGLSRNIKQCLEDFSIPLFLSHTVTSIRGKNRLESIEISKVDEKLKPIKGTEKNFEVDCLLLSVGLIPENSLSEEADILLHSKTKGPIVNQRLETSVPGIFACGNVLHVHDLVDYVSAEGKKAGYSASQYIMGESEQNDRVESEITIEPNEGIGYVLPQVIQTQCIPETIEFMFRVTRNYKNAEIAIYKDGKILKTVKKRHLAPAEMEKIKLLKTDLEDAEKKITFQVIEKEGVE